MKTIIPSADVMKLYVDNKCPLGNIQKQFNAYYPFLKLEFFTNQLTDKNFFKAMPLACESVKHMFIKNSEGTINVEKKRTVAEVENDLKTEFGLSAQVFRLSGNVWIETTLTDDWTLEKQNKEGEQISSHFTIKFSKGL
jgi:hypothetical protein